METKKKILILYDYFPPAYKAGGPIQSLSNLVRLLKTEYQFFVYTSNKDLDKTLLEVDHNRWMEHPDGAMVYYSSKKRPSFAAILDMIKPIHPDVIYINGLYSLANVIWPLFFVKTRTGFDGRVVIAPRGMLSSSALAIRKWKKRLYLLMMRFLIRRSKLLWHATSKEEINSIHDFINNPGEIILAQNIPNIIASHPKSDQAINKSGEKLLLVTVAVISPMKNILEVLRGLLTLDIAVQYDIYGPIKEPDYWKECRKLIAQMPDHIACQYKEEISPNKVVGLLRNYHIYVQPSQSENFGHSIFEALQAGLPVVTSHETPWNGLKEANCGRNVAPTSEDITRAIIELNLEIAEHKTFKTASYIQNYLSTKDYSRMYRRLFDK